MKSSSAAWATPQLWKLAALGVGCLVLGVSLTLAIVYGIGKANPSQQPVAVNEPADIGLEPAEPSSDDEPMPAETPADPPSTASSPSNRDATIDVAAVTASEQPVGAAEENPSPAPPATAAAPEKKASPDRAERSEQVAAKTADQLKELVNLLPLKDRTARRKLPIDAQCSLIAQLAHANSAAIACFAEPSEPRRSALIDEVRQAIISLDSNRTGGNQGRASDTSSATSTAGSGRTSGKSSQSSVASKGTVKPPDSLTGTAMMEAIDSLWDSYDAAIVRSYTLLEKRNSSSSGDVPPVERTVEHTRQLADAVLNVLGRARPRSESDGAEAEFDRIRQRLETERFLAVEPPQELCQLHWRICETIDAAVRLHTPDQAQESGRLVRQVAQSQFTSAREQLISFLFTELQLWVLWVEAQKP